MMMIAFGGGHVADSEEAAAAEVAAKQLDPHHLRRSAARPDRSNRRQPVVSEARAETPRSKQTRTENMTKKQTNSSSTSSSGRSDCSR